MKPFNRSRARATYPEPLCGHRGRVATTVRRTHAPLRQQRGSSRPRRRSPGRDAARVAQRRLRSASSSPTRRAGRPACASRRPSAAAAAESSSASKRRVVRDLRRRRRDVQEGRAAATGPAAPLPPPSKVSSVASRLVVRAASSSSFATSRAYSSSSRFKGGATASSTRAATRRENSARVAGQSKGAGVVAGSGALEPRTDEGQAPERHAGRARRAVEQAPRGLPSQRVRHRRFARPRRSPGWHPRGHLEHISPASSRSRPRRWRRSRSSRP